MTPRLKRFVKQVYQCIVFYFFFHERQTETLLKVTRYAIGENTESFFGYFDTSPVNITETHILYHSAIRPGLQLNQRQDHIEIICQNLMTGAIELRLRTSAYNLQQGSRLRWLNNHTFCFNDYSRASKAFVANLYDLNSKRIVGQLPCPLYDTYGDHYALTLNFSRLFLYSPEYGYPSPEPQEVNLPSLGADGVWKVNISTGEVDLVLSLRHVISSHHEVLAEECKHTVNHISISPDGSRFFFIHRWYHKARRFDRLMLSDINGAHIETVVSSGMVSHCAWLSENKILGFFRDTAGEEKYQMIHLDSGVIEPLGIALLAKFGDGHPSVSGDWFIVDSYPDRARMQHLILCNWKTRETRHIGSFFHGLAFQGFYRCDLHPRFNPSGTRVYFDSVFTGKRNLYGVDL